MQQESVTTKNELDNVIRGIISINSDREDEIESQDRTFDDGTPVQKNRTL